MAQRVLHIGDLPTSALDAAGAFHSRWLAEAREACRGTDAVALVFAPARHDHRTWRLAAVQDLAREAAPCRVNGVVGNDDAAIAATIDWLAQAPGVTGQLLMTDPAPDAHAPES